MKKLYVAPTNNRYLERYIYLIAGVLSIVGVVLGYYSHQYWYILNLIVGINLVVFSITGFCTMTNILIKFGIKSGLKTH